MQDWVSLFRYVREGKVAVGTALILIDLTLIKFGWRFELDLYRLSAGVIFVI